MGTKRQRCGPDQRKEEHATVVTVAFMVDSFPAAVIPNPAARSWDGLPTLVEVSSDPGISNLEWSGVGQCRPVLFWLGFLGRASCIPHLH